MSGGVCEWWVVVCVSGVVCEWWVVGCVSGGVCEWWGVWVVGWWGVWVVTRVHSPCFGCTIVEVVNAV